MMDEPLDRLVADAVRRHMDKLAVTAIIGSAASTTTAFADGPALTVATLDKMLRDAQVMKARLRRASVTVQVEQGHIGPALMTKTDTDGTKVECSHAQACEIHAKWPLVLREIVSTDIAIFVPATPFDPPFPMGLMGPPYELPRNAKIAPPSPA